MPDILDIIQQRAVPFSKADLLEQLFSGESAPSKPLILYGAGSAGKELKPILERHGLRPIAYCDANPARVGRTYCDLPVLSIQDLRERYADHAVLITVGAHREAIREKLIQEGIAEKYIFSPQDQEALCYYTHLEQWRWSEDDLLKFKEELALTFSILSDQSSRDLFLRRVSLFTQGAHFQAFKDFINDFSALRHKALSNFQECAKSTNYDSEAYLQFNNDVLTLEEGEVLVDGGAFNGDSTLEFLKAMANRNLNYDSIHCFEPDPAIFKQLERNTCEIPRLITSPLGLWSCNTTLRFVNSDILKPGSTRIHSETDSLPQPSRDQLTEIHTTSIDKELAGRRATIIKMDIEGAEVEALKGAAETILRHHPKLIISAYHKRNDLFEIPNLIHRIRQDYRFYYRHFSNNFGETTLFAIPAQNAM